MCRKLEGRTSFSSFHGFIFPGRGSMFKMKKTRLYFTVLLSVGFFISWIPFWRARNNYFYQGEISVFLKNVDGIATFCTSPKNLILVSEHVNDVYLYTSTIICIRRYFKSKYTFKFISYNLILKLKPIL